MQITVTLTPKTRLQKALQRAGVNNSATVASLTITGKIIDSDLKYIRENMAKTLQELDLSKASFEKNKIPFMAFENCTGLTSVTFPDTVTEFGDKAFSACTGLTSVKIPASVVEIEIDSFESSYGWIFHWSFSECPGLSSIWVHPDNPVFASQDGVLFNKDKTELIMYPAGRQGDYVISESVTEIRWYAFHDCKGLTSITVHLDNTDFSSVAGVLYNKDKTSLLRCPEGYQGKYIIPDSVGEIEYKAFFNCAGLTSIFLPASLVEMGTLFGEDLYDMSHPSDEIAKEYRAFCNCDGLTAITTHSDNPLYASEDGILFNRDKTELIVYPVGRQGNYIIPDTVVKIRNLAFANAKGLTSVTIPASVTEIGRHAFIRCIGLTSITIPNSMTEINHDMFCGCTGLTTVDIPDSVTVIGANAFLDCTGLTSINIPNSVVKIFDSAFKNCTGLTSIHIPASVIEIGMRHWNDDIKFYKCPAYVTVHPDNLKYTSKEGKIVYKNVKAAGRAGELKWRFSGNTLTISGNGEIPDYDDDYDYSIFKENHVAKVHSPWYVYRKMIRKVVFKGNISMKGDRVFNRPYHLISVTFENCTVPHFSEKTCNINDIIERVFHGYIHGDSHWYFNKWFSWQIPRMLKQISMSEHNKQTIDRMAFCLSEMKPPSGTEDSKKMKKYREKMKNEGFALLCENFEKLRL